MTKRTDTTTTTKEVKKGEQGILRKRTPEEQRGGWQFRLTITRFEAQRCLNCGARYWVEDMPLKACPACQGELYDVVDDKGNRGERRQVCRGGFATKKAAELALAKARVKLDGGEDVARKETKERVGEYLRSWLADVKEDVRPTTWRSYQLHVVCYLIPRLGSIPLRRLTTAKINATYRELREGGRLKNAQTPLSALTVRHSHAVLRLALKEAVATGRIPHNPAIGAKLPKDRGEKREMQTWSAEQLTTFLDSTRTDRMHEFWYVAAFTGLRRGELAGLKWGDVTWPDEDGQSGSLRIRRSRVSVGGKAQDSLPKTEAGGRDVAVDPDTVRALRRQAARQGDDRHKWKGDAWQDTDHVFTIENGQPLHPERISLLFRLAVRNAIEAAAQADPTRPLPRVRLHDLRHSHATFALEAGVPVKVVSQRLGHSSTRITEDVYQHVLKEVQEGAAVQIADYVRLASKPQPVASAADENQE